ncbi:hypothetical protein BJY04DRAFT_225115 [Aspergillus karnatakaensis]|uniref:uncharacterized protein n=1 Tax=Aspergillus karnatakaensis TaxID=1810916 RepID=UPI003CCCBE74
MRFHTLFLLSWMGATALAAAISREKSEYTLQIAVDESARMVPDAEAYLEQPEDYQLAINVYVNIARANIAAELQVGLQDPSAALYPGMTIIPPEETSPGLSSLSKNFIAAAPLLTTVLGSPELSTVPDLRRNIRSAAADSRNSFDPEYDTVLKPLYDQLHKQRCSGSAREIEEAAGRAYHTLAAALIGH